MNKRIEQINELIKRELSQIILRESDLPENCLTTIVDVKTASNFQSAKIYISVIPESRAGDVMQNLNQQIYSIQQNLNHRLKIRPVPKIIFSKM